MEMRKTLFCAVAVLAAVPALAGLRGGPVPAIDTAGIHVATYYGGRRASVTFTFDDGFARTLPLIELRI